MPIYYTDEMIPENIERPKMVKETKIEYLKDIFALFLTVVLVILIAIIMAVITGG